MTETHVGYDAKHVFLVAFVDLYCLFVVAGKFDLRPSSHAQGLEVVVEGLGGEFMTLFQYEAVEVGEGC
ncbi:hypothetical protein EVA_02075 [gut metagenome]|uniref:Uncharacterized protein n=1 Tax=gut metagenome TaxID=749906 RepID=J9DAB2_9ZZZZ